MAYTIPEMPLLFAVWDAADDPTVDPPRAFDIPCNLGYGRRVLTSSLGGGDLLSGCAAQLLMPALTDIRGYANSYPVFDKVEVPQGTGRYYVVIHVDDFGKGFPNEHRFALITLDTATGWTPPYP